MLPIIVVEEQFRGRHHLRSSIDLSDDDDAGNRLPRLNHFQYAFLLGSHDEDASTMLQMKIHENARSFKPFDGSCCLCLGNFSVVPGTCSLAMQSTV
jgi:hypothetical protein